MDWKTKTVLSGQQQTLLYKQLQFQSTKYVMIIGKEQTPYLGGAYYFKISKPKSFPKFPPEIQMLNKTEGIVMNQALFTKQRLNNIPFETFGISWSDMKEDIRTSQNNEKNLYKIVCLKICELIEYNLHNKFQLQDENQAILNNQILAYGNLKYGIIQNYFKPCIPDHIRFLQKIHRNLLSQRQFALSCNENYGQFMWEKITYFQEHSQPFNENFKIMFDHNVLNYDYPFCITTDEEHKERMEIRYLSLNPHTRTYLQYFKQMIGRQQVLPVEKDFTELPRKKYMHISEFWKTY